MLATNLYEKTTVKACFNLKPSIHQTLQTTLTGNIVIKLADNIFGFKRCSFINNGSSTKFYVDYEAKAASLNR